MSPRTWVWLPFRLCLDTWLPLSISDGSQGHKCTVSSVSTSDAAIPVVRSELSSFICCSVDLSVVSFIVSHLLLSGVVTYETNRRKIATGCLMSLLFVLECPLQVCPSNWMLLVFKTFALTKFRTQNRGQNHTKNCHRFFTQIVTFYHICFIFLPLL